MFGVWRCQPGTPGGVLLDVPGLKPKLRMSLSEVGQQNVQRGRAGVEIAVEERELIARIIAGERATLSRTGAAL